MEAKNIVINSNIAEHWIWKDKSFSKGQAYIDILLLAMPLDGELITTEKYLMERWGWSKSKLRLYLSTLEKELKINRRTDQRKTSITVVNYSTYTDITDQKRTTEKTIERPQEELEIITKESTQDLKDEEQEQVEENQHVTENTIAAQANIFLSMLEHETN